MNTHTQKRLFSLCLLFAALTYSGGRFAHAQQQENPVPRSFATPYQVGTKSLHTLRGLEGVRVMVNNTPYAEQEGVTRKAMLDLTEAKLREAGLRAFTMNETQQAIPGQPILYLNFIIFKIQGGHTFLIDLQLRELITTVRQPETKIMAATWQHSALGNYIPSNPQRIVEGVGSIVDLFVRDYKAANSDALLRLKK